MTSSQQAFIDKLCQAFPDVQTSGQFTRSQVMTISSYMPAWVNDLKVERGVYKLPTSQDVSTPNLQLVQPPQAPIQMADITNKSTLIPTRDKTFVPFGNFADLEVIIKSP